MYSVKFWAGNESALTTDEIRQLFEEGQKDSALGLVAYDCPPLSADLFETFVRRLDKIGFFAGVYDEGGLPVGFFFLSCFEGDTARIHFCLFQAGRQNRHEIGRFVLSRCFVLFKLKCLIGVIPVINQGACRYSREMGGRRAALIPGACWISRLRRSVGGVQYIFTENSRGGQSQGNATPALK